MSRQSATAWAEDALLIVLIAVFLFGSCIASSQVPRPVSPPPALAATEAPVLLAKFDGAVNTKSAKVGDVIAAKTTKDLKLKDLDIPRGSKLIGSVASVQSMQAGGGTSSLAIRFDHVELKGGAILRIQGLIVSIGPAPELKVGLGYNSVLNRGGAGATPELDPSIASDHYGQDRSDLPKGSTLEGVALGLHLNATGATELRGVHRDIKLDLGVMVKVALYRPTSE